MKKPLFFGNILRLRVLFLSFAFSPNYLGSATLVFSLSFVLIFSPLRLFSCCSLKPIFRSSLVPHSFRPRVLDYVNFFGPSSSRNEPRPSQPIFRFFSYSVRYWSQYEPYLVNRKCMDKYETSCGKYTLHLFVYNNTLILAINLRIGTSRSHFRVAYSLMLRARSDPYNNSSGSTEPNPSPVRGAVHRNKSWEAVELNDVPTQNAPPPEKIC